MPQPLVILWCGDRMVFSGSTSSPCWASVVQGHRRAADTIRSWNEEFPEYAAARLVATDRDAAAIAELAASAARSGRRLEGAWPLQSLLGRSPLRPSLEVVAVGATAVVRFDMGTDPPNDVWYRQFDGAHLGSAVRAEIQEVLARVEEGAAVQGTLTCEDCPCGGDWRGAMQAGTAFGELALESLLDRTRQLEPGRDGDWLAGKRLRIPQWLRGLKPYMAAAIAVLSVAAVAGSWRNRRRVAESEAERAAWSRGQAAQRRLKAMQEARRTAAELSPPVEFPFLSALASATPPAIVLDSVHVDAERFSIAGSLVSGTRDSSAAELFRRSLFAPGASWREDPASSPLSGQSIGLRGSFLPRRKAVGAQLVTLDRFASELAGWSEGWRIDGPHRITPEGDAPGLADVRYRLTRVDLGPSAWESALRLVRGLASVPGLTIDHLALDGAPAGDGSFTRLELALTARLLPPDGGPGGASAPLPRLPPRGH